MPIFTYQCKDCGEKFDLLLGVNSDKEQLKCKKCNSKNIVKMPSAFSVGAGENRPSSSGPSCSTGTCPTCG